MDAEEFKMAKKNVQNGFPEWFHHHGIKMKMKFFSFELSTIIIDSSAAKVNIEKSSSMYPDTNMWIVDWAVVQCRPLNEGVSGRVCFSRENLATAFMISRDLTDIGSQWMIERFEADSASQGKYIRRKNFLNIPCPGTGHDGDPNVSIFVSEEMKRAVFQLLK